MRLEFISCVAMNGYVIPLIEFLPVGPNDESKVHHRYLFLTEMDLLLSQCVGEVLHTRLFGLFYIRR